MIVHMVDSPDQAWGVREIARGLHMSHSTAHRILGLLEEEGFVTQEPASGHYRLGLELYRVAWRATGVHPIRNVALPILQDLVQEVNETALLGLYDPARCEMIFAASVESRHPLRYVVETNRWVPIHAGATGLAILAFLPAEEQAKVIDRAVNAAPLTARTLTNARDLQAEAEAIRHKGYACTGGQRIEGAVGIAAPIWGANGRVVGDVAITLPDQRFSPAQETELAAAVIRAADRITHQLGGTSPAAGFDIKAVESNVSDQIT